MKGALLMLFFFATCISAHAQYYNFYINFDSTDTLYQQSIVIDTVNYHNNIWQIGKPHKTVFDSAYSYPNAIVTDTLNPYPPNDTSVFILKMSGNVYGWWVGSISFYYQLDIDSGSRGVIDVSSDYGASWTNVTSLPGYYYPNTDTPSLSISTTGWTNYEVFHYFELCDTIMFRFTFISDSVITTKNGWIIDNIGLNYAVESVPELSIKNPISIYPNPATTELTITATDKITDITITNLIGQTVYTQNYNTDQTHIDVAGLPTGVYFIKINGSDVQKFIKE